ncbi:hypothetical protein ACLOJK_029727, partial [Asimina triloba]
PVAPARSTPSPNPAPPAFAHDPISHCPLREQRPASPSNSPSTPARSGTTAATPLQPTVSAQIWPWPDPAIAARSPLNDTRRP